MTIDDIINRIYGKDKITHRELQRLERRLYKLAQQVIVLKLALSKCYVDSEDFPKKPNPRKVES